NYLRPILQWPVTVMLVPQVLQALLAMFIYGPPQPWKLHYLINMILSGANTVAGVGALCWLGMRYGVTARNQGAAIVWTVAIAKGVPYLVTLCCSILIRTLGVS